MNALQRSVDPDLVEMMRAVLTSAAPRAQDLARRIELDTSLWASLDNLGLVRLTEPETSGGSGAGWHESAALIGLCAENGLALPLGEHDLLAGWLLSRAGVSPDAHRRTVAILDSSNQARAVPWATTAERLVVVSPAGSGWTVGEVALADAVVAAGQNRAGEPRDFVTVPEPPSGTACSTEIIDELHLRGALLRAVQIAGALEGTLRLMVEHAIARVQFGRPLARFQAVQHMTADAASEVALTRSLVNAAVGAADLKDKRLPFLVAAARSAAGHAVSVVVRHAHQVHGAIGTTDEHHLHNLTMPALAWRSEFGSTASWDGEVARAARAAGSGGLWELIAG